MTSRVATVAFQGIEAVAVDVQAQFLSGQVQFHIVGLPDKAVAESRERVRAALYAIGLGLPGKRLAINLSPADLPKEGSHFDLPIALAVLSALGVIAPDFLNRYVVLGELALDGSLMAVAGALPAAIAANGREIGLLRRLVRNLLENARRHGGGTRVEIAVASTADAVTLHVSDRGPGVSEAERERIFEPFYRVAGTAESGSGVGLGLALVRQISRRHGGDARCEARVGGGSVFVVTLQRIPVALSS